MSGNVTVDVIGNLKLGFEDLNYYPVETLYIEELRSLLFSPSLGRIQLLKWCLSSLHDEMEQHLNTTDDNNLEKEIVKQVISFGFCPLGKQGNIILGRSNAALQVILWETIISTLTQLSQMKDLNRPAIYKHLQFLENLTVNFELKKLLHTKVQVLPVSMQSYYTPASEAEAQKEAKEMHRKLELMLNNVGQMKIDSTWWCLNSLGKEELDVPKIVAKKKKFCDMYGKSLKPLAMQIQANKQAEWFDEAMPLLANNIHRSMQLRSNKGIVMQKFNMEHKPSENLNIP